MQHTNIQQQYTCPMHPEIVQDKPGNCPKCGMTLVLVKASSKDAHPQHQHGSNPAMGHEGHNHNSMIADFKKRFYAVLVLTIPIMLLSEMIQHWLNLHISFPGSKYVLLALSSVVFIYGGWPFLKGLADDWQR
jgi:P-type Cu2+ transporter